MLFIEHHRTWDPGHRGRSQSACSLLQNRLLATADLELVAVRIFEEDRVVSRAVLGA